MLKIKQTHKSYLIFNNKSEIRSDIKKRILYAINESLNREHKATLYNSNSSKHNKLLIQQKLNNLTYNQTKIKNRCILTARSRSTYRHFKLSRIMLRNLAAYGLLPGITKSSW